MKNHTYLFFELFGEQDKVNSLDGLTFTLHTSLFLKTI